MSETAFVIGMGEVGSRLASALQTDGMRVVQVTRDEGWERAASDEPGLRVVCVREEVLEAVLGRLDGAGIADDQIVLVQNGWIRPLLEGREDITRGLIWFTAKGSFFRVLRPSPFCGPRAQEMVTALNGVDIAAEVVADRDRFAELDADKMGFNCVVGLPLAVHRLSLGAYLEQRADEAEAVFTESVEVCARAAGVTPPPGVWSDFVDTVQPLSWVKASSAKALEYRNGAVVKLAHQLQMPVPVNQRLLATVGSNG